MEIPDGVIITSIGGICAALSWSVKTMIGNLKKQISDYDGRLAAQERETEECKRDRKSLKDAHKRLKDRTDKLESVLGVAKMCPKEDCPNKLLMKETSRSIIRAGD